MVKKVLTWGGIAFLLFFIAYRPESAIDLVQGIGNAFVGIGQGVYDVVSRLIA